MKITIKSKKDVKKSPTLDELEPGTVFKFSSDATALKLENEEVVILKYTDGDDWFALSDGSMNIHTIEILGSIDEIILVKNVS